MHADYSHNNLQHISNNPMAKHSKKRARICESPAVVPLAPSAITQCPAEIWGRIFALACIDGGFTGRALSCVSRYIMETSRPYKYQCLTVTERQFRPLTTILKKLPADRRRIRYLFLAEECWGNGYAGIGRASEFFHTDKNRLLQLAAASLEVLEVGSRLYRFAVPFQLPVLVKLILHGYPDQIQPSRNIVACYPALRCLFVDNFPTMDGFNIPAVLNVTAINLAKVRLRIDDHAWARVLPQLKAMTQIQKVLLQPKYGCILHYKYLCGRLGLDSHLHDKIIMLKPSPSFTGRNRWPEVCSGRLDYWQPDENEIDLAVATDAS